MATDTQYEGRTADDLIKGYWDPRRNEHVKGLWERVTGMEAKLKHLPLAFWIMVFLQTVILAKSFDSGAIVQLLAEFLKLAP